MKKFNVGAIGYSWATEARIPGINAPGGAQVTAVCSCRHLDPGELSRWHGVGSTIC